MGISLGGFSAYPMPMQFGRALPGNNAMPPELAAKQSAEQSRINQLQAQYGNTCACARCSNPKSADELLNKMRAESEAHIMGHEQAHASKAGRYGGSIHIERDSNGIAFAGHVPISIPGLDSQSPESSMLAYSTIRDAALAPGDPSGQDMAVAAHAQSLLGQAQVLFGQKKQAQSLGIPFDEYRKMSIKPKL